MKKQPNFYIFLKIFLFLTAPPIRKAIAVITASKLPRTFQKVLEGTTNETSDRLIKKCTRAAEKNCNGDGNVSGKFGFGE